MSNQSKKIEVSYTDTTLSTNGGLLLLNEVDNQLGLIKRISSGITDHRNPNFITHTIDDLLRQRILQIAAGYEDCNDSDFLRDDPVIKTCLSRSAITGTQLGSQPTLCRLENSITPKDLFNFGDALISNFIESYESTPNIILLDFDDTNNNTYGQQELTLFNNYYHEHCYMPLHVYEGFSGRLITTLLKPGRRNKSLNVFKIMKRLLTKLKEHWPNTIFLIRGDAHFTSAEFMNYYANDKKVYYTTGLSGNSKLNSMIKPIVEAAKKSFELTKKKIKRYHTINYKAGTWNKIQKVIVKIEVSDLGTNIRYVVSNLPLRAAKVYENAYCPRGEMELKIKEHKLYLKSDRMSCRSFIANQFRLFLHSAAYVLLHTFQNTALKGTDFESSTFDSIQKHIIKSATKVEELKTKIKIHFSSDNNTMKEQLKAFSFFNSTGNVKFT